MKRNIIISLIIMGLLSSCTTTSKVNFRGNPGTEISTPDGVILGTIPVSGSLKTSIPDDGYYGILVGYNPSTKEAVPFALNTKHSSHRGSHIAEATGYSLSILGTLSIIGGTIAVLVADDNDSSAGTIMLGAGGGAALIGTGVGVTASSRQNQTSYEYNFKYLPDQTLNNDIVFTKPVLNYTSEIKEQPTNTTSKKLRPRQSTNSSLSGHTQASQKVKREVGDIAKKVSGVYAGNGSILLKNEEIESVRGVTVKISRKDATHVMLSLIESDGNDFFGEVIEYTVRKGVEKNSYMLVQTGLPSSKIYIDKNGNLTYENPRLEIDDTIYLFKIKAEKQ